MLPNPLAAMASPGYGNSLSDPLATVSGVLLREGKRKGTGRDDRQRE